MVHSWTYNITVAPAALAVALADFKTHLRITGTAQDAELTAILNAAIGYAEKYTKRDFITRTYETYRNDLSEVCEIRRSKLQSITSITYLVSGSPVTVSSDLYYNTVENDFSRILLEDGESWPTNGDTREQSVVITFKSGYGDADTDVPKDLKQAIMQHATSIYENRGDCSIGQCADCLPLNAALTYQQYRINDIVLAML